MKMTLLIAHPHLRLTKRFARTGSRVVEFGYDRAKMFVPKVVHVQGLAALLKLLRLLQDRRNVCLIRGLPVEHGSEPRQRLGVNFRSPAEGLRWVMIDCDVVPPPRGASPTSVRAVRHVIATLPPEFHRAWCIAQFSSSAGIQKPGGRPLKPGVRVHLFYVFDRPVTNEQLRNRFRGYAVDQRLFNDVQIHYTAAPVLDAGVKCDLDERLLLIRGVHRTVAAKHCEEAAALSRSRPRSAALAARPDAAAWQDPRDGLPSPSDLVGCDFMRWFVAVPNIAPGRYDAARAFATNAFRTAGDSEGFVREGLDANRPGGYEHSEAIVRTLAASRPITCQRIYETAFRCPQMDPDTGLCRRAPGVRTPFGLGMHFHRMKRRGR